MYSVTRLGTLQWQITVLDLFDTECDRAVGTHTELLHELSTVSGCAHLEPEPVSPAATRRAMVRVAHGV